ncbi:MAG: hypothetical protein ACK46R_00135, partial [Bacteroidota bacterium]
MKNKQTTKKRHQDRKWALMLFLMSFVYTNSLIAQTTIFTETMGTVGGTTTIAAHETANGFDNDAYTMTGGAAAVSADLRATSFSSGYTGASGAANVFFTTTNNQYGFAIEGIDASNFSSLQLQFGYRKESAANHATFAVEFWNGSTWVNVANTPANLFNEAVGAATGWYLSKTLALPTAAQIAGLKIRFLKSGTLSIRVDDVKLTGIAPSITPSAAPVSGLNYTFGSGPSTSTSFTFTGANLTGAPGNITVDASGTTGYEVSTDNITFSSSVTYAYSTASLAAQTVHVRLKAGLAVGAYNNQSITISGGGASSSKTASGDVVPPTPILTLSTPALTGFNYIFGFGPSTSQSFTVTGSNLAPANSNVVIDAG